MTATPRLAITELANNQATPETAVNEALLILEFFANGCHFKSRATTAEPGSPSEGDCYLLTASPTGTHWSGNGSKIALFYNGAWTFKSAKEGFLAWVDDEDIVVAFDGTNWNGVGTAAEATDSQVWTGTDTATRISPRRLFSTAAAVTVTDASTVTLDGSTGLNFKWTIGGNRTLANPTNMKAGQSGVIVITQDGTGSRTLSYGTNWRFPGGSASSGVLSTAASAVDVISYFVRADGTILATLSKAFAA